MMWKEFRAFSFQQFKILSIKSPQQSSLLHNWNFRRMFLFCFLSSPVPKFTRNLVKGKGKYQQPTQMLFLKTESYCPDRIALCNRFPSLMSGISLRCVGDNKDFICNENNPSLASCKQEISVKEEELPKKSKEEQRRICSKNLNGQCLPNHSYRCRSSSVRQMYYDKMYFIAILSKKEKQKQQTPKRTNSHKPFPSFCFQAFLLQLYFYRKMKTKHLIYCHTIV